MKTWLIVLVAAALTLTLSPSIRNAGLRLFFYRDFPETPYDWAPRARVWRNGVEVQR